MEEFEKPKNDRLGQFDDFLSEMDQDRFKSQSSKRWTQIALVALVLFGLYYFFFLSEDTTVKDKIEDVVEDTKEEIKDRNKPKNDDRWFTFLRDFYPVSTTNEIIDHEYFALSYSEYHEQPEWVAYEMTVEQLNQERVERTDNFRVDKKVKRGSATLSDYRGSGYDRGHLCPAGDMAFSPDAMSTSFFMSNMSPQERSFNRGIWRELEESVRDWTRSNKNLYIVTGPVLSQRAKKRIGSNKVVVPRAYYKALLDLSNPEQKAVAFVIPNERSSKHLHDYMMTIDSLEQITGLDFFPGLPDKQEAKMESEINPFRWMVDADRYSRRLSSWNYD